jgi:C1A family cysteine protease
MPQRTNAWYGCKPDLGDHRDRIMSFAPHVALPSQVDLRQWCPPVMNQGELGSCTAHGVTGCARWHIIKRNTTYDFEMSRLQLYYDTRYLEGTADSDSGAEIRDAVKTMATKGVGHEEDWPYDIDKFTDTPPQSVYDDAVQYRALKYERVPVSVLGLKTALYNQHPVVIGISVYESFENDEVARTGMVPMPGRDEALMGGHCMYVTGYGQKPNTFTVRNSWGDDWGDKGNCYIPESYLGSPSLGNDYWLNDLFGSAAEQQANVA